jgi:hypothetical protein
MTFMNDKVVAILSIGFVTGSLIFVTNYGSPQGNYRKSFDRTIECREKVKTQNVDLICGKIPQWSEFVKGDEK